jgi:hypothetical protein
MSNGDITFTGLDLVLTLAFAATSMYLVMGLMGVVHTAPFRRPGLARVLVTVFAWPVLFVGGERTYRWYANL